jgi:hypothetical protein
MLSASLENVGEGDVVSMLFSRGDTRIAAKAFLKWFRQSGGKVTKRQLSNFSYELASGTLGCRLSRTNFYKTIFHRFLDLGLIAEQLAYDPVKRKGVPVYRAVVQPIPSHRPISPSLTYLAHVIAEKWNEQFRGVDRFALST